MHALEKNGLLKTQNEEFLCLRAAPERIWAKMSEAGWSENGNRKLNEKMGICWHLQHTGHDGHCAGMREVHPWRANICAGAEGWFPSGWAASARAGECFQEASSLWSRCRATSWLPRPDTQLTQATDVKTILNPGRARHKILFTQFPFCVRNRVVFRSAQFFVLFNFI